MYYTYAYLREDKTPYYIGKGTKDRIHNCGHNVNLPPKERRIILKRFGNEEDAYKHEMYMIAVFGRKWNNTGILRNIHEGGAIFPGSNLGEIRRQKGVYNEEFASKISETLKRKGIRPPSAKGKKWWHKDGKCVLEYECPGDGWQRGRPVVMDWCRLNQ